MQKEKETALRILQCLNFVDKPLGLLLNNVQEFQQCVVSNEYESDNDKKGKFVIDNKIDKKKHASDSDSDSDGSHSDSSEEDFDAKKNREKAERTFTILQDQPIARVNPKNLASPVDRLKAMREDIQLAFDSYEKLKKAYEKQVQTYKQKTKVRKMLKTWMKRAHKMKKENKKLRQNAELMQTYVSSCIQEMQSKVSAISGVPIAKESKSAAVIRQSLKHLSPVETPKDDASTNQLKMELAQAQAENEKLKDQLKQQKEKEEGLEKQVAELQHHKKLLIKEVKNLRSGTPNNNQQKP